MKAEIAAQTGSKYRLPGPPMGKETNLFAVIDKRRLRSFGKIADLDAPEPDDDLVDEATQIASLFSGAPLVACGFLVGVFAGPLLKSFQAKRRPGSGGLAAPLVPTTTV